MSLTRPNTLFNAKRPAAIVAMLLVSLFLIGVLGWQSWRLQQSNDAAADSVLREYAILVADEFGRRLTRTLGYQGYYLLISSFDDPQSADEMHTTVSQNMQSGDAASLAGGFFVFDGNTLSTKDIDQESVLKTLLDQLYTDPPATQGPYYSARTASGEQQLIYAIRESGDRSRKIFGFTIDPSGVSNMTQIAFDSGPLLPPSLADGRLSNELLFAEVSDPNGVMLFERNRQYDSQLTISKILNDDYQGILEGFKIQISVDPDSAASLLIGGLPQSRLPLLLIVMVMVVVLMLAAIWLFRREHAVMKLRADFVSQVSHELRTPLTQIRMFAETLLLGRTRTDDESRRSLEIIDRESRRLSHLVDNILRFSNISDASQIDRQVQALAPIIREVSETMQSTSNGVAIRFTADESVTANVDADALRQIVLNLLDNAVKYGPRQQTVSVDLSVDGDKALISVSDQGPGIPATEWERVWEAFYRLKRERDTAISGTGIGLSVVRELVEAMQGRCWIDTLTTGTRVKLEFPAVQHD